MEKLKKLYLLLKKREKVKLVINKNTFKERLLHWKFRTDPFGPTTIFNSYLLLQHKSLSMIS